MTNPPTPATPPTAPGGTAGSTGGGDGRRTPLDAVHRSLGATMAPFAGWVMPLRYGSERAEHLAVRANAGLFDLSHMGEITVSGPRAGEALDYALVGSIAALAVHRARYTMMCGADGGVLDDLIVYRTGEQEFLVVANAANSDVVLDELSARAQGFDATVRDDRSAYALIAVQGPQAAQILRQLTDADVDALRYYTCVPGTVAGATGLIARTGYTGEDGFEVFVTPEAAVPLWDALTEVGTALGLVPAGLSCRDTLRLEAGMPLYGHELTDRTTPFDAGLGRVVKMNKSTNEGRFVGRDALSVAAENARLHPPRRLVGLVSQGRRVPRAGFQVIAQGQSGEPSPVGEVTSGAPSPTLGTPIAMAYLDPAHAEPGTRVAVDIRGALEPHEVVALPFYKRDR